MYALTWDRFSYSRRQFGLWRIAFGFYLSCYFIKILPFGTELFSHDGPFANLSNDTFKTFFPTSLLLYDSATQVQYMLVGCIVLSVFIMVGFQRSISAALLWVLTIWFYNRNPFSDSPEYGFVNWLIFACIFIPSGESYSFSKPDFDWKMPKLFYWGAWIVLGVGYFYAGSSKFRSHDISWMNGQAMYYVLTTDNARLLWYGNIFEYVPRILFVPITYMALIMQTFAIAFIYFRKVRPWWWLASTAVHIGLLFFVNLSQLTLGMIFFHLFLLDHRWVTATLDFTRHFGTKVGRKPRPA